MEELPTEDKKNDSKYRRYVVALEKCLQSFESVNEWADVISFLSRLGKVFQSFPTFKEIPFKLNLAKRLAQCLNPALPAGVHQKTLEVYEIVFRKIGNNDLSKDLSLYSFGLFPFFEHSTTLVKNSLLELYEVYLVPLGIELRPSLRPLVLSIILGLEEENGDCFIKVNNLLNRIKMTAGISEFYDAIWTGLLISPRHRLAIINFLLKNIPSSASTHELMEICVNNTKLVSSALSAALQDHEQLVVRGSLEILLKHFPVDKKFFELKQMVDLFQASMNVLTRKDMSLTRRFYNWILISGTSETETLSDYNLSILTLAFKSIINQNGSSEDISKPFKLLVFILDKPNVSDPLCKDCLFLLVKLIVDASKNQSGENYQKLLNSANLVFRMLDLDVIWGSFAREILKLNLIDDHNVTDIIEIITFAIKNLSVYDDSSSMIQVHVLINLVLTTVFKYQKLKPFLECANSCFELCICLMDRLDIISFDASNCTIVLNSTETCDQFTELLVAGKGDLSKEDASAILKLMFCNIRLITSYSLISIKVSDISSVDIFFFEKSSRFLYSLMNATIFFSDKLDEIGFNTWFENLLKELENATNIQFIRAIIYQISEFSAHWIKYRSKLRLTLTENTLPFLWSKFCSKNHDRDTLRFIISTICRILPNESDIYFAKLLSSSIRHKKCDTIDYFTEFWNTTIASQLLISVPLRITVLILVDSMTNDEFKFRSCSKNWIFSVSTFLDRFLIPALSSFIDILECSINESVNSTMHSKKSFRKNFDKGPLIYYLNIIERLLKVNFEDILNYLIVTEVDPYVMIQMNGLIDLMKMHLNIDFNFEYGTNFKIIDVVIKILGNNYFNLLIILCLPLIAMEEQKSTQSNFSPVRVAAIEMLCVLLNGANSSSLSLIRELLDLSIFKLNFFVTYSFDSEKQTHFLKLFNGLMTNSLITPLIDSDDIVFLAETNKRALELTNSAEIMHSWTEFIITLGLLPNTNIDIIVSVLNNSLIFRLQNISNDQNNVSETLLPSIFLCVTKLAIFYLAAKSNLFTDNLHLRSSVSCLLNEAKTETTTILANMKLSATIKIDDLDNLIMGLFEAHLWLTKKSPDLTAEESSNFSHCMIVFKESCYLMYSTNRNLITDVLLSLFTKYQLNCDELKFHQFFGMFYNQESNEFIRSVWAHFKTSKDTWKNQETLLKFMLEYSNNENEESVIINIWTIFMSQVKDFTSSGYKFKAIIWLLLENCCLLMSKLEKIDNKRLIKDFDLIIKLIENSAIYAAKLNESSQWTIRSEDVIAIDSDRFTCVLLESVKDKNIGKCMNSICRTLIPNLSEHFRESDKLFAVTIAIVNNLVAPNFKSPLRYSLMGQISAYCFGYIVKLGFNSIKIWRRDLWEAFFENSFLLMPHYYFSVMSDAFKLITLEPDRFSEVLGKFSTSATASMFLSKDAEILNKALHIRRLSFLTFWGNFDTFRMHLPSLQEKLVELTRYYNGYILGEIFFLIRVMLRRLTDESISSLWPLIMTELVQLFENFIKSEQSNASDLYAIFHACKLVDMMLTLRTSSILLYHWLFFDSSGHGGLFLRMEQKIKKRQYPANPSQQIQNLLKRRPILSCSVVKDSSELLYFLENARSHLSHDFVIIQNLDIEFINEMTEKDLLEIFEIK